MAMGAHSKNLDNNTFKIFNSADFSLESRDFETKSHFGSSLAAQMSPEWCPDRAQRGPGGQKLLQDSEKDRQESANTAQEGPKEAYLEALWADVQGKLEEHLVKIRAKIRECKK